MELIPGLRALIPANYFFGRWIPLGVYLMGDIYSSIEYSLIIKISLAFLFVWILFTEILRFLIRNMLRAWNLLIWALLCSIFSGCIVSNISLLPERASLALTGIVSSSLCLGYWASRNALGWYLVYRKKPAN